MNPEALEQNRILLDVGHGDTTLFRNNTGMGWVGESRRIARAGMVYVEAGDMIIKKPRPLHAGLHKGSSDLIGWHSFVILPEHVGCRTAAFLAVEAKARGKKATAEQNTFLQRVRDAGGLAGVAYSSDDARAIIAQPPKMF